MRNKEQRHRIGAAFAALFEYNFALFASITYLVGLASMKPSDFVP